MDTYTIPFLIEHERGNGTTSIGAVAGLATDSNSSMADAELVLGACQGITPSNSKGGLPAPEAGTRAEEGGVRDEIDPSPSRLKSLQDKAEPQTAKLTQLPEVVEGRARPGGPT